MLNTEDGSGCLAKNWIIINKKAHKTCSSFPWTWRHFSFPQHFSFYSNSCEFLWLFKCCLFPSQLHMDSRHRDSSAKLFPHSKVLPLWRTKSISATADVSYLLPWVLPAEVHIYIWLPKDSAGYVDTITDFGSTGWCHNCGWGWALGDWQKNSIRKQEISHFLIRNYG